MKTLLMTLLLCLLFCGTASACIDPDPDQMGIYFDQGATIYCTMTNPYAPVPFYVIYTRPTLATIEGFEFGITLEAGPGELIWDWGPIIFIDPPELDNIRIAFSEPVPTTAATVLARGDYLYLDASMSPVTFYLHGARVFSTGDPALPGVYYPCGDDTCVLPVGTSTAPGTAGAQINGDCGVVDSESETWGGLKSLYR